ncbi:hypothetical protein AVEN_265180-1 [Araneus ventricosus]|uniref:Uncharacterized protein n=1 Tax=Araneus ventricosus TaxID=182803 RepID=A0A4Y2CNX3_ARAVE|nr:hypothetical protein AVEN_265180-1 [Araneus ventricosus]
MQNVHSAATYPSIRVFPFHTRASHPTALLFKFLTTSPPSFPFRWTLGIRLMVIDRHKQPRGPACVKIRSISCILHFICWDLIGPLPRLTFSDMEAIAWTDKFSFELDLEMEFICRWLMEC